MWLSSSSSSPTPIPCCRRRGFGASDKAAWERPALICCIRYLEYSRTSWRGAEEGREEGGLGWPQNRLILEGRFFGLAGKKCRGKSIWLEKGLKSFRSERLKLRSGASPCSNFRYMPQMHPPPCGFILADPPSPTSLSASTTIKEAAHRGCRPGRAMDLLSSTHKEGMLTRGGPGTAATTGTNAGYHVEYINTLALPKVSH